MQHPLAFAGSFPGCHLALFLQVQILLKSNTNAASYGKLFPVFIPKHVSSLILHIFLLLYITGLCLILFVEQQAVVL